MSLGLLKTSLPVGSVRVHLHSLTAPVRMLCRHHGASAPRASPEREIILPVTLSVDHPSNSTFMLASFTAPIVPVMAQVAF